MELRHIRYFMAAAEELNISRASRRLNVSQPAMSRLVHDLEDELGAPLFVRERFGLRLTAAGDRFLVYARQIQDLTAEAAQVIRNLPATSAALNIGFIASSLGSFLGDSLRCFRDSHPGIPVKIHELSPADQVVALRKRQIDLALIGNPCEGVLDEFEVRILFEMELQAVIPERHPLADRTKISLGELARENFIGYAEESFPGRNQTIITACKVAGFRPEIRHQAHSLVEVLAMIGAGSGVCLMPADVASLPHPNTVLLSVHEQLEPIRFAAAWRRNDERISLRQLLECLPDANDATRR